MAAKIQDWDRQPKESEPAFAAFVLYRDMGQGRTAERVAKECRKHVSLIARWSAEHKWARRVAAYDAHLDRAAQKAAVKQTESRTETWLKRRDQALEDQHEDADLLVRQGRYLASFPTVETEKEVGGKRVVYKPAKPGVLVSGGKMMALGVSLRWDAINKALAGIAGSAAAPPVHESVTSGLAPDKADEVRRSMAEFTAQMEAEARRFLNAAPPAPDPYPTPDPG